MENTCVRVSFLIKLQASGLQLYIKKETLAQMFSFEFCKIFKNTFFKEHLWTTASEKIVPPNDPISAIFLTLHLVTLLY